MPVYVGDLLISKEGKSSDPVDIPASLDINAKLPADAARSITGLRQKINIISDRLIMAWAGNLLQARLLMREIATAVEAGAESYEDIGRVIESIDETDRNEVSVIGTILARDPDDKGVRLSHFNYCAAEVVLDGVEVRVAGTGANDLLKLLSQTIAAIPAPDCNREDVEFFRWTRMQAHAIAGSFIGHETSTGQNLLDWWGGAIEIATLENGRFKKISNTLNMIWRARKSCDRYEIALIPKFIKYDYFEDAFVAQTLDATIDRGQMRVKEHSFRVYTPLLKGPRHYDLSKFKVPSFDHTTLACYVLLEPPLPDLGNFVWVQHSHKGDTPFKITPRADVFILSFRNDLLKWLEDTISQATGLPATVVGVGP